MSNKDRGGANIRISIKSEERNFTIWLPTRLLFNPIGAAIALSVARRGMPGKYDIFTQELQKPATFNNMRRLFAAIRKSRRTLKGQPLLSARSAGGDDVDIWI